MPPSLEHHWSPEELRASNNITTNFIFRTFAGKPSNFAISDFHTCSSSSFHTSILCFFSTSVPNFVSTIQISQTFTSTSNTSHPDGCRSTCGLLAVWAPKILIYFLDTQIWYFIFCSIFGGVNDILHHLGEIRKIVMVRSRFYSPPSMFNASLVAHSSQQKKKIIFKDILKNNTCKKVTDMSFQSLLKFGIS